MAIQKIMVPFLDEGSGTAAFETGVVLAERFKAHLDVVHMRQRISPALTGNGYYPIAVTYIEDNIDTLTAAANNRAEDLKKLYERLCRQRDVGLYDEEEHTDDKGVTAAWADVDATLPYDLSSRARVSDLTILARAGDDAPAYEFELVEEIIFQSGRPVLLADTRQPIADFPDTVVVAWNGGREAARAITAAMPILKQAKLVIVMSVGNLPWASEPPDHVASYLKLHGVRATALQARLNKGVDPEEEFMALVKKKRADLIVMGAYSHSRWREVILGGFTRHLLRKSKIPILMAH
ncbi:MAG: universal stress protein [Marinicaulis sp.]|nr:universal stress protein [Marinicaulis sp.]NNE40724.1 universal stress protein [Marinicaulis sp.]NNL87662.1 universal stress protein [Marinicaulis sp.]